MNHRYGILLGLACLAGGVSAVPEESRPNILFCMADDWSWMNAGCYGDTQARTPNIDGLAAKGIRFKQAYCASPSCAPARAAVLTGRMAIELEEAANLLGAFPHKFQVYPELLEEAGYHVGFERKGWAPGNWEDQGWNHNPAGKRYPDFYNFLKNRPEAKPFCFWFGSTDPHLPYAEGYAEASGFMPDEIKVPPFLMDTPGVRKSFAGYLAEIARFDREVGRMLQLLDELDELDNTLVVITSDNGMPFPGGKTRLYDRGTRMPLIVHWKNGAVGGRVVDDFVSIPDLAPTFLEAAGLPVPDEMSGKSLMPLLTSKQSGQIDPLRDFIVTARERHCPAQPDSWGGYPMRSIRTQDFLYIRNYEPDRWPQGDYPSFIDADGSACKTDYVQNWNNPEYKELIAAALGKKPAEELFDLRRDPHQLNNLAGNPEFSGIKAKLEERMNGRLKSIKDPRMFGEGWKFDTYEWFTDWKHKQLGGTWKESGQEGLEAHEGNAGARRCNGFTY